jgi:MFS family permease
MKRSGWASVIASWFCLFAGASSIIVFTFGNFPRALTAEFGWSRGLLSNAFACSALAAAIATPILGWLVDRYGIRRGEREENMGQSSNCSPCGISMKPLITRIVYVRQIAGHQTSRTVANS